jgi:hypothetical protein
LPFFLCPFLPFGPFALFALVLCPCLPLLCRCFAVVELIDASDEAEDFRSDLDGAGADHGVQYDIHLHPFRWAVRAHSTVLSAMIFAYPRCDG